MISIDEINPGRIWAGHFNDKDEGYLFAFGDSWDVEWQNKIIFEKLDFHTAHDVLWNHLKSLEEKAEKPLDNP